MPEVFIHLVAGRPLEQKVRLIREITDTMVRVLDATRDNVLVQINETPAELKANGGVTVAELRAQRKTAKPT